MYKIITEDNKTYSYYKDNKLVVAKDIASGMREFYLKEAATNRFGEDNFYINQLLKSLDVLQAESKTDKYKTKENSVLPKYLRVVPMENKNNTVIPSPNGLVGIN